MYDSVDRWDRFEATVARNVHSTERIVELDGSLTWKLPSIPLEVRVHADHLGRASEMTPVAVTRWDERFGITLGLRVESRRRACGSILDAYRKHSGAHARTRMGGGEDSVASPRDVRVLQWGRG